MGGYREQVHRACREIGARCGSFDYLDVLRSLPSGPYAPTDKQLDQMMRSAPYLDIAERGTKDRPTRYKLRKEDHET